MLFRSALLVLTDSLIFAVWYAFAGVIAVVEQKKMNESVKTSKAYVKGRWWPIFWRLIGICFITFIIQAIAWALLRLLSITEIDGMNYIGTLVSAVIGAALALYFNVFFFELYTALARTAAK